MSLLHSFYCWGAVGVILGSTLFFPVFGTEHWRSLTLLWACPKALEIWLAPVCLPLSWDSPVCYTENEQETEPGKDHAAVRDMLFSGFSFPLPILSLPGCALCGFSVGVMWPGTISLSSQRCPRGGTAMFAFLALAGDPWRYSRPGSGRKFLGTVWRQSENRTAGRHNFPDSSGSLLACFEPKDEISHPKVTELQKFQKDTCFMCTFVLCQCRSRHFVCERHYLSVIIKSYETSNLCDI